MPSNGVVNNAQYLYRCMLIALDVAAEPGVHKYNHLKEYRNKPTGLLSTSSCLILITPTCPPEPALLKPAPLRCCFTAPERGMASLLDGVVSDIHIGGHAFLINVQVFFLESEFPLLNK